MNVLLPIYGKMNEIIEMVNNNDVTIITAETGSGKSTQVPQYLYNAGYDVIITQPRRLPCISLADRVYSEMCEDSPIDEDVVAYHTAFESTRTENTKILFCTDGLQVARIGIGNRKKTVMVIDEVHEWNLNVETLVAWANNFISEAKSNGRELSMKFVLMSATIDCDQLVKFFNNVAKVESISIKGKRYRVNILNSFGMDFEDEIIKYANRGCNILAFVSGKKEIDKTIEYLMEKQLDAEILALHGQMDSQDQRKCFNHYTRPKVIICTNIAQTSITIDDIDCVIDTGTEKRIEISDGIEGLFLRNISKADCLQRAGRAGRTKEGTYVLCSSSHLEDRPNYSKPEIKRMFLDKVVLKLMSVNIDPEDLSFYHQPDTDSIVNAKVLLNMLGAIKNNEITDIGREIIKLPVSVRFGRMIVEAEKYDCVEDIIKIISIAEIGSLLGYKLEKNWDGTKDRINMTYQDFVNEKQSDLIAELKIYNNILDRKYQDLREAGINKKNFFKIKELVTKLNKDLCIYSGDKDTKSINSDAIIKCIISGLSDTLYKLVDGFNYDYARDSALNEYRINRGSCISMSYDFVYGIPKIITYKDKWAEEQEMNILTFCTGVSGQYLLDEIITPDCVVKEIDLYHSSCDPIEKTCRIYVSYIFRVFILSEEELDISADKNPDEYDKYTKMYPVLVKNGMRKYKKIGEHFYKIQHNSSIYRYLSNSYIDIKEDDIDEAYDIWTEDHEYFRDNEYNIIYFHYDGEFFSNISDLKSYVDHPSKELTEELWEARTDPRSGEFDSMALYASIHRDNRRSSLKLQYETPNRKKEMNKLIPKGETDDCDEIIKSFIPKLIPIEFNYPEFNMEGTKYPGLIFDKKISFKLFDSDDEANNSTTDALRRYIKKYIRTNMGDKTFTVIRAGVKFTTDAAKVAKEEFREMTDEIIGYTTSENFEENMEFIKEIYADAMERLVY